MGQIPSETKSMRDFARDSVALEVAQEFGGRTGPLADAVLFLASRLPGYREEGTSLSPQILITSDLDEVTKPLPNRQLFMIGQGAHTMQLVKRALKATASIARDNWMAVIETDGENLRYGILSIEGTVASPSPYHLLRESFNLLPVPAILLRSPAQRRVELLRRNNKLSLNLSLEPHEAEASGSLSQVAAVFLAGTELASDRDALLTVESMFEQACEESHGCMLLCVDSGTSGCTIEGLQDAHYINPPINVLSFLLAKQDRDDDSRASFRAVAGLIRRMASHDGALVLSTDGRVLAFNAFLSIDSEKAVGSATGGRGRAFDAAQRLSCCRACAVFSQDGELRVWDGGAK